MNGNRLLTKLLLKDVSFFQLFIYAFGSFLGVFIIVASFHFYRNFHSIKAESSTNSVNEFITLSRRIEGISVGQNKGLQNELDSLRSKDWVVKADKYSPSKFNALASVRFGSQEMETALFFESVPKDYFDEIPPNWTFNAKDPNAILPIVLPRDYLALYNFGFASSRGLPKIGENVLTTIPIEISVSGNGLQRDIKAKIAGFSSRLNTIAVPEEFIEWGNATFSRNKSSEPTRIIAEISISPTDKRVKEYIETNNLEIGGDKSLTTSAGSIIDIITSTLTVIGSVICVLAIGLLIVSIFLLMHKTRSVIYRLVVLGFTSKKIILIYFSLFCAVNLLVLGLSIGGIFILNICLKTILWESGIYTSASVVPPIALATGIMILISTGSLFIIRHNVNKIQCQ